MSNQRKIIEVFNAGEHIWEWDHWVKNYIQVMHADNQGKGAPDFAEHIKDAVYYIREPGSKTLSPALQLRDNKYSASDKQPGDNHRVNFKAAGLLYRPQGSDAFLHFDYSPSGGYEVPPEDVLEGSLTLEALKSYTKYYIEDREGYRALRAANFGDYRLADKRAMNGGKYNDAWAVTRGEKLPEEDRVVYLVEGAWVPVTSVRWSIGNDYPLFSFKLNDAIKMIGEFLADSQED